MTSKYSIRIHSPKRSYRFEFRVYKLEEQSEYYLDPSSHYFENAGKIPPPPHHEVEIITPFWAVAKTYNLFAAKSDREPHRTFINSLSALPTLEHALELIKAWSVGSIFQMESGPDLNATLYGMCDGKIPDFLTYMKKSHGIRIVSNPKLEPE